MPYTGANIEQDVLDILNRTGTSDIAMADLAVKSAHSKLQGMRDWDAQRKTYRRLSNVNYRFAIPSDFKSPRQLFRVAGTDLASDLIPALPSVQSVNDSPFYNKTSMEQVLAQRATTNAVSSNSSTPNSILTQTKFYTVENGFVELTPKLDDAANQVALQYYNILAYVDTVSDWFTDKCFEYLTLEALIFMVSILGEVDDRVPIWRSLLIAAMNKAQGFDIAIDIGGDALVMRG